MRRVLVVRHAAHEALGNLELQLRAAGLELEMMECFDGDWVRIEQAGFRPGDWAGLVVMGGPMNVDETDRYPNLAAEVGWIQAAVAARLPLVGVCLGAQLLAKSLGSRVFPNRVKEIGWYEVELLPAALDDPLLAGSHERETVFQWHGDTFDLPAGAVHLARSATCAQQAFRYGPNAYGLQFHLEMTAEMVADWLEEPCMCGELAEATYLDPHEIRRRTAEGLATMAPLTERVYGRFGQLCSQRAGT
jgi:GMP synthase (glutamine-hydrolysing)